MLRRVLALALMLVAASACTSAPAGGGPVSPATTPDAGQQTDGAAAAGDVCELVTETEIADATGRAVTDMVAAEDNCTWTIGEFDTINLRVESRNDPELQGPHVAFPEGEDVSGLGDRAYWVEDVSVLYFVRGGIAYAVQLVVFSEELDSPRAVAESIARFALARL